MKRMLLLVTLLLAVPTASHAQQTAKEALLRQMHSYLSMVREFPELSLADYEAAITEVAKKMVDEDRHPAAMAARPVTPRLPLPSLPRSDTPAVPRTGLYEYVPPSPPTSGHTYDWRSGNVYNWTTSPTGSTTVRGMNMANGSIWNSTIKPDGSQTGTDKNLNYWTYNARTGTYMNMGTGQICTGQGAARLCTGGGR
ncbi:MAG: hypothetical protein ABIW19_13435 [Vicinamibacterales bacterium]